MDKTAQLWDASSCKKIGEPLKHRGSVGSAQFSPDGKRVVTSGEDGTVRLWDASSCKEIGEPLKHKGSVGSACFSPDGKSIVTTLDRTAWLWNAENGKETGELLKHEGVIHSALFSPDGLRVVTASADWTALIWNVPAISDKDAAEDLRLLAGLAEASSGLLVERPDQPEVLHAMTSEEVRAEWNKIVERFPGTVAVLTPLQRFLKWSASEPSGRTISPFFELTVGQWIETRINEGTIDGLRAAMQVKPANARLIAYFGRALARDAPEKDPSSAEARRARAEADFQMRRALKLAPDDDEVKKLCAEVVSLLTRRGLRS